MLFKFVFVKDIPVLDEQIFFDEQCVLRYRMPAYIQNRWSVLVFGSCIVVCLYIIMSIFLAVIFDNFKKHLKVGLKLRVIFCFLISD